MEELFEQERQARLQLDTAAMIQILDKMMQLCITDSDLLTLTKMIGKRKGQLPDAFKYMINRVVDAKLDSINIKQTNIEPELDFLNSLLKDVVEGKMYLEEERVRISEQLKSIYERIGDDNKALRVVFDVPVETFTSISEKHIVEFQLEQLRLAIKVEEWIKGDIIGKRIRRRYFKENDDKENEYKYNSYLAMVCIGQGHWREASDVMMVMGGSQDIILGSFFGMLGYSKGEDDAYLKNFLNHKNNISSMRSILKLFLSQEIIPRNISIDTIVTRYLNFEKYKKEWIESIDQHNFGVVSKFFKSLNFQELADIMQCDISDVIDKTCSMVWKGWKCKIDHKNEIIRFSHEESDEWMDKINVVLDKIMKANHLIHKENLKAKLSNKQ
ncbi:26S proteasome non-ATPase regulatory subunit 12 [Astathelohania contejeani]|uniref:26S proteasome non-ATPase regulatory subunit 12 n=1 Tax=Astathelohania contejeani TaxID=164912 RepID=A0ABQ7I1M8_9MICR|nr:26S proteasome non-ATPase regulatory subunit 12 [Thelohania contejeani]